MLVRKKEDKIWQEPFSLLIKLTVDFSKMRIFESGKYK